MFGVDDETHDRTGGRIAGFDGLGVRAEVDERVAWADVAPPDDRLVVVGKESLRLPGADPFASRFAMSGGGSASLPLVVAARVVVVRVVTTHPIGIVGEGGVEQRQEVIDELRNK